MIIITEWEYVTILLSYDDPDPDPLGSGDFWPAGSGTFFNGSGWSYKIIFILNKI